MKDNRKVIGYGTITGGTSRMMDFADSVMVYVNKGFELRGDLVISEGIAYQVMVQYEVRTC